MISNSEIALRLAVAAILGSLIGFERERLLWTAGIRTHMLVSVGACLFMIVSAYGFQHATTMPHVVLDPSRIAAQVVSGIGFLGAGSILLRGQAVRGLTTAASIWSVAALGLASGGGLYFAAVASTVIILGILAGLKPLEDAYRARNQSFIVHMIAERSAISLEEMRKLLRIRASQIKRVLVEPLDMETEQTTLFLTRVAEAAIRSGANRIENRDGVRSIEIRHRTGKATSSKEAFSRDE